MNYEFGTESPHAGHLFGGAKALMKKKSRMWLGLVCILIVLLLSACSGTDSTDAEPTPNPVTGGIAPDFTLPDSEGNMVHLAEELQNNESVVLLFYLEHT